MARVVFDESYMRKLLLVALKGRKHSVWAKAHGVNQATLSLVLSGDRDIPESIARALGFTKVTLFTKKPKEHP